MYLHTLPIRLEFQGPEISSSDDVDQVHKLLIDGIYVSEHNTARIKAAAMAAHYKAYVLNEDIQASAPTHTGTLASITVHQLVQLCQTSGMPDSMAKLESI